MPGAKALPGGKAENGDLDDRALESAGTREVMEETGVVVAPDLHYVRSNVFSNRVMNVLLIGRWETGEPHAASPGEVSKCLWLSAERVFGDDSIPEWEKEHIRQAEQVRHKLNW